PFGKTGDTVGDCETYAADIALMEVSYGGGTTVEKRLQEVRELRRRVPKCKIVLLCDENSAPDIAREVMLAKRDGLIDNFIYSSVTAKYLLAALSSI
ncbi:MAG: response regulator transcription factor, partial [Oscillospiraceae bacterium]|nr:response regulator transcription factor [Oscillospiraceae bacterium]